MEEIEELQRMLAELQESKPRTRLSERNAMDILEYLRKQQSFQLISTLDGCEFLTLDALDQAVYDTLLVHKKLRVRELENMLNLSADIIEARFGVLQKKFRLTKLNEQLITQEYIEFILKEIDHELSKKQICALSDFALANDLEVNLLRSFIQSSTSELARKLSSQKFINNVIYSQQFFSTLERKITGALNGSLEPIKVDKLCELTQTDRGIMVEFLAGKELKREGDMILPKNYSANRKKMLQELMARNGYVEYSFVQSSFSVSKPKEYIKENCDPTLGTFFDKIFVLNEELERISTLCQQGLKKSGIFDCSSVDHIPFGKNDRALLSRSLGEVLSRRGVDFEHEAEFIFLRSFLKGCIDQTSKLDDISEKSIIEDLIKAKKLEFMAEDSVKKFVASKVRQHLALHREANFAVPKKKKEKLKHAVDYNKFSVDSLVDRFEFISQYYLLTEKAFGGLGKTFAEKYAQILEPYRTFLQKVVLQNMMFLLLRKYKLIMDPDSFNPLADFEHFPDIFQPIFKQDSAVFSALDQLPKELKAIVLTKASNYNEESPSSSTFDVTGLLLEKGATLNLPACDVQKNKKREKAFFSEMSKSLKEKILSKSEGLDSETVLSILVFYLQIEAGFVGYFVEDLSEMAKIFSAVKEEAPKTFKNEAEKIDEIFEKFHELGDVPAELDEYLEETKVEMFS